MLDIPGCLATLATVLLEKMNALTLVTGSVTGRLKRSSGEIARRLTQIQNVHWVWLVHQEECSPVVGLKVHHLDSSFHQGRSSWERIHLRLKRDLEP